MVILRYGAGELVFDPEHGCIASLSDGKKEYIADKMSVFKASLRDGDGKQYFEEASEMELAELSQTEDTVCAKYVGKNDHGQAYGVRS